MTGQPPSDMRRYRFTLYVSGASDFSSRAVVGAKAFCEASLPGRYDLSVRDLGSNAEAAFHDRVLATPTLIRTHPSPERRYVGDISATERVGEALGLSTAASAGGEAPAA